MPRVDDYFSSIEEHFVRLRESPLLLSPKDWWLIQKWKEEGIPLSVVLQGLNRTFDKFKKGAQKRRKINSIAYCAQEVLSAWEEFKESLIGKKKSEEQPPLFTFEEIASFLGELQQGLERAAKIAARKGKEELEGKLRDINRDVDQLRAEADEEMDLEKVEERLEELENIVKEAIRHAEDEEVVKEIERQAEEELKEYRRGMSPRLFKDTVEGFVWKKLLASYKIPRMSIFYLKQS